MLILILFLQKPDVPVEIKGPFDDWIKQNPIGSWVVGGVTILIIVMVGYYLIEFFRKWITEDPNNDPAQKLSELEQLKSTAYMTDEEKKRLNAAANFGALTPGGPLDPELAEFRKIKQLRMQNEESQNGPTFEEIEDQPDQ